MLRKGLPLIAAVGLVVAGPPGARADLCFCYGTGGGILVAKGATLPADNTCEALPFFEVHSSAFVGLNGAANGLICTDRSGGTVIFHYTYDGCSGNYFESATCRLNIQSGLPTTGGGCRGTTGGEISTQVPLHDASAILTACNSNTICDPKVRMCLSPAIIVH
jgi:hypothetical protein